MFPSPGPQAWHRLTTTVHLYFHHLFNNAVTSMQFQFKYHSKVVPILTQTVVPRPFSRSSAAKAHPHPHHPHRPAPPLPSPLSQAFPTSSTCALLSVLLSSSLLSGASQSLCSFFFTFLFKILCGYSLSPDLTPELV